MPETPVLLTMLVLDIEQYGSPMRDDSVRVLLRRALRRILTDTLTRAGIPEKRWHQSSTGDGLLVQIDPSVAAARVIQALIEYLLPLLNEHNRVSAPSAQCRVRAVVHGGHAIADEQGVAGEQVNLAFRLLDSQALRDQLTARRAPLVLAVSDYLHQQVVRHRHLGLDPDAFVAVEVTAKETRARAWVYTGRAEVARGQAGASEGDWAAQDGRASRDDTGAEGAGAASPGQGAPLFRNRRDELEKVLHGLTNASGPHSWLVIAPPHLGKSSFLRRLSAELAPRGHPSPPAEPSRWTARLVDVRAEPLDARSNAAILLARLFGLPARVRIDAATLRGIAQEISRSGRPYLCLLDSAELLEMETATTLRSWLSDIYVRVQQGGKIDVRLAFVVASRRETEWGGVAPAPRLSLLPLTEFTVEVVRDSLRGLAGRMGHNFPGDELHRNAVRAHSLSEGLPALLVECLLWIQREEWQDMNRLDGREVFEELAHPYIENDLLSVQSLLPWGGQKLGQKQRLLKEAFRILVPYRLFTQSHLRNYLELQPAFEQALRDLSWVVEDLWRAIGGTALLQRPLREPWHAIYAPIRRLLYRYYYESETACADAHRAARKFVEVWADKQFGTEQAIGMVECLYHEAVLHRLEQPAALETELGKSARSLSRSLRGSTAYTVTELRNFAVERMRGDEELYEAVGHDAALMSRLMDIVRSP